MNPADDPDLKAQLRHYRGAFKALRFECDRLEAENANLRRKLQMVTNTSAPDRIWSNAIDGRK